MRPNWAFVSVRGVFHAPYHIGLERVSFLKQFGDTLQIRFFNVGQSLPIASSAPILPFTAKEIEDILAPCDKYRNKRNRIRLRALVLLVMTSGLRLGDAVSLPRERIRTGRLYLRTAKAGTDVSIPLPPETLATLAAIPHESIYYFWTGKSKN
jgi:integrase